MNDWKVVLLYVINVYCDLLDDITWSWANEDQVLHTLSMVTLIVKYMYGISGIVIYIIFSHWIYFKYTTHARTYCGTSRWSTRHIRTMRTIAPGSTLPAQKTTAYSGGIRFSYSESFLWGARSTATRASSMGIGFTSENEEWFVDRSTLVSPKYGLSVQQMHVLGLTPEGLTKIPEVELVRGFDERGSPHYNVY